MAQENIRCPKCQGEMQEGFRINNFSGGLSSEKWLPGAPQKSFWTGIKVEKSKIRDVITYCCTNCGFLESYVRRN